MLFYRFVFLPKKSPSCLRTDKIGNATDDVWENDIFFECSTDDIHSLTLTWYT
jgi:hypothetical protein